MQCIAKWNIIATYCGLLLLKYSAASCIMPFYLKWWISKNMDEVYMTIKQPNKNMLA